MLGSPEQVMSTVVWLIDNGHREDLHHRMCGNGGTVVPSMARRGNLVHRIAS
jgi:hypothetical protein